MRGRRALVVAHRLNAGASLAVVAAIALLGLHGTWAFLWFAFAGAAAAMVLVQVVGSAGAPPRRPAAARRRRDRRRPGDEHGRQPGPDPAGIVTAFVGAPVLIWLIRRERSAER